MYVDDSNDCDYDDAEFVDGCYCNSLAGWDCLKIYATYHRAPAAAAVRLTQSSTVKYYSLLALIHLLKAKRPKIFENVGNLKLVFGIDRDEKIGDTRKRLTVNLYSSKSKN